MLDDAALIKRHRAKGVLVDTNLLVLFLVGLVNRRRILNFKRTSGFTLADYDLLLRILEWFGNLIVKPHILSQVSDLIDLSGRELTMVRDSFKLLVERADERYDASKSIVSDSAFASLGLADAAIVALCSRGLLVLTTDAKLHPTLQTRGIDALNFNRLRLVGGL